MSLHDLLNLSALAAILATAICRINLMTRDTRISVKLSYIALSTGAFSETGGILFNAPQGIFHALLVAGIAGVLLTERRRPKCYRPEDCG